MNTRYASSSALLFLINHWRRWQQRRRRHLCFSRTRFSYHYARPTRAPSCFRSPIRYWFLEQWRIWISWWVRLIRLYSVMLRACSLTFASWCLFLDADARRMLTMLQCVDQSELLRWSEGELSNLLLQVTRAVPIFIVIGVIIFAYYAYCTQTVIGTFFYIQHLFVGRNNFSSQR